MSLQSKSLADLTSEQTSAADTDLLFIESAGTPAKIAKSALLESIQTQIDEIPAVIDEDDMSSDSATRPPSQQSTKAYVDAISSRDVAVATCDGSSTPTLTGARNLSVAYISSGTFRFTFLTAEADANYHVFPVAEDTASGRVCTYTNKTTTTFDVIVRNTAATLVNSPFSVRVERA